MHGEAIKLPAMSPLFDPDLPEARRAFYSPASESEVTVDYAMLAARGEPPPINHAFRSSPYVSVERVHAVVARYFEVDPLVAPASKAGRLARTCYCLFLCELGLGKSEIARLLRIRVMDASRIIESVPRSLRDDMILDTAGAKAVNDLREEIMSDRKRRITFATQSFIPQLHQRQRFIGS